MITENAVAPSGVRVAQPGARILVVDDAEYIRTLTIDALAATGYHVTEAGEGASALSLRGLVAAVSGGPTWEAMPRAGFAAVAPSDRTKVAATRDRDA